VHLHAHYAGQLWVSKLTIYFLLDKDKYVTSLQATDLQKLRGCQTRMQRPSYPAVSGLVSSSVSKYCNLLAKSFQETCAIQGHVKDGKED
jgi:hypothetical protein